MSDSFQEWFSQAKEDPKVAAQPFVIFFALLFLGYKFLYSPQKVLLTKALKQNRGIENQISELELAVENISDLKLELNQLRKIRAEAEGFCYKKSEVPIFLQEIRRLGKQADVDFKSINPQSPIPRSFETLKYEELPVKVSFSGNLKQLGMLLRGMEMNPKLIYSELPDLVPDASGSFKCDLLLTAIIIPDPLPKPPPPPE